MLFAAHTAETIYDATSGNYAVSSKSVALHLTDDVRPFLLNPADVGLGETFRDTKLNIPV